MWNLSIGAIEAFLLFLNTELLYLYSYKHQISTAEASVPTLQQEQELSISYAANAASLTSSQTSMNRFVWSLPAALLHPQVAPKNLPPRGGEDTEI